MRFTTEANRNMTCLQGYISTTYAELVERFGEPELGGDKTTAEWALDFEDGTVATIYDWKEYETPLGTYRWHIGGHSYEAVERVYEVMGVTA